MQNSILPVGTKIYYTGDMANASGFGEIALVRESRDFGNHYEIKLADGREMKRIPVCMVSEKYNSTCAIRFVTRAAYDDFRAQVLKQYEKAA